jgi:uncharacterized protein
LYHLGVSALTAPILLSATLTTASALALLYMILLLRIVRMRFSQRVSLGDGGNEELQKRIRAHGNFAEYVPMLLILMGLVELAGASKQMLGLVGAAMVLFRISHVIGIHRPAPNLFRVVGTVGTFTVILGLSGYGLWRVLGA